MLDRFKQLFGLNQDQNSAAFQDDERALNVAVCALFVEMGRIDETFSDQEMDQVGTILTQRYGLPAEDLESLMAEAGNALNESVDLWQFARVINERFSVAQKEKLIERLWRIVYVDGTMDAHEHYLMNKLSKLLRLSHKQLIDAKLKVLHES